MSNSAIRVLVSKLTALTASSDSSILSQEWTPMTQWNLHLTGVELPRNSRLAEGVAEYVSDVLAASRGRRKSERATVYKITFVRETGKDGWCLYDKDFSLSDRQLVCVNKAFDRLQSMAARKHLALRRNMTWELVPFSWCAYVEQ